MTCADCIRLQERIEHLEYENSVLRGGDARQYEGLTPSECRIVTLLVSRRERPCSRDALSIAASTARSNEPTNGHKAAVHIHRIREKRPDLRDFIVTIPGLGYKWIGPAEIGGQDA